MGVTMDINHPGREIKCCIYLIICHPDHHSFKRRGNFLSCIFIPKLLREAEETEEKIKIIKLF
jgi:hypothetical protein